MKIKLSYEEFELMYNLSANRFLTPEDKEIWKNIENLMKFIKEDLENG